MSTVLATSRVALRDRPFVDVLDLSFRFMRSGFGPVAKLAAWMLPVPIVSTVLIGATGGWWWGWFYALCLTPFVAAPFTVLAGQFVFEENPSVRQALKRGLRGTWRLFLVFTVVAIALSGGLMFFVVPAFWMAVVVLFVTEALLLERATILGAFERSLKLTGRAPGDATLGRIVTDLALIVAPILTDRIGELALASIFQVSGPPSIWEAGGNWLAALGYWLVIPYVTVLRFLLYINVRTRTEGWDIQTAFATLAAESREDELSREAA